MSSVLDLVNDSLGNGGFSAIAEQLGIDTDTASKAVGQALPALLGALSHNASDDAGAGSLLDALTSGHDGSALANPMQAMLNGDGAKILGHVFGNNEDQVSQLLGNKSGIGSGNMSKLLVMLAPLLLGALGKMMKSGGNSKSDLQDQLDQATTQARGGDSDNVLGGLGDILGGVLGGSGSGGGGVLGSILGKVLGN